MKPVCWPHTVRLTISIQHSNELLFFLKDDALSMIEYLYVTNEEPRHTLSCPKRPKSDSPLNALVLEEMILVDLHGECKKLFNILKFIVSEIVDFYFST